MVVHTLQCTNCEKTRIGRDTNEGVLPVRQQCPDCGSRSYERLAAARSD